LCAQLTCDLFVIAKFLFIIIIIIKYVYIGQDREEAANALGNSYK